MEELIEIVKECKAADPAIELLYKYIKPTPDIEKAVAFTIEKHKGQYRKSGEEYVIHPILVCVFVAYLGGDESMIVAGLLHDVVEDTSCSTEDVKAMFGEEVRHLVDGLTKIVEIRDVELIPSSSNEKMIASALTFRKMLIASIRDVRVLVVKLCDRLHNMLTLGALDPLKQRRIAEETLVVYAPIAHRLGISSIKNLLEDLSFYYVMPNEYAKIDGYIKEHGQQLQLRLNHFISKIKNHMLQEGFIESDFTIQKRVKHYYSIYLKMQRKGVTIEEVLDLLAIRIIVRTPIDCYRALGIVHQHFKPLISRFKDYIAIPKENGYQTIHTTVFDDKSIVESQIRTYDMNKTAEYGVAAHWKYKSGGLNPKLDWLNELNNQNEEIDNIEDFYAIAKDNLYSEDIAVFSPKGDIFTLPRGATVLDFAYEVHTEVGTYADEAYVNKQKVPLLTELKNGDIVRIVTSSEPKFRCSWINSVKTGKAKSTIQANCRQKIKEINHKAAIKILSNVFGVTENKVEAWVEQEHATKKIFKIATDSIFLQDVANTLKLYALQDTLLFPLLKKDRYHIRKQKFENIVIYSNHHISNVYFDYCCHPKRGDDILGFKRGNDVFVHHKLCERAAGLMEDNEPMVFVKWTREAPDRYKLIVSLENKKGSLAAFLAYLAKMQINLVTIELGKSEDEGHADYFEMILELPDKNVGTVRDNLRGKYRVIEFVSVNDAYK
ncbi:MULTISPECIES: bifunctional (p)ppGpp synthetase/guanosine-3',5'-bis(diphosphate) 3'-pyrophosphohydrolase [Sulfurospirillum]|uniref:Bifunctional (P)ppGpp synthetase/guanosine-3',5'-bis(Diphosphate) 3'-pyrophosphohydrolase n=1 Tax=Sulfurospirillum cavolei TaxID=366522 RepID=A0A2D3WF10_9BACT|nr:MULTISPECIES: RelA/SpoT family protein [Sulfurospirillum]MCD8544182.1 RelA/SpoT family protein [Sulfurospirillum cavolei]MCP3651812.1 RelA/SpoT family protein [Sulfurospirillum sp. DNRA8]MCR1810659.1 RelA/SpoT family protein [Sulfurospirillum sp. DNRA8]DAB35659.1 MAG TPA: bifunctional (p)ppGpp synthetase/guanosine-3',5'-bis(diphosphate) 3'-pyrophosphohydrolase [Sulfurospirillum cavolei]